MPRIRPTTRKALLTLHLVTSLGWLGTDLVLLTLGIAVQRGADPGVVYPVTALVGTVLFAPLSVLVWLIGVASSLLTPWGLLRHRWVLVKLVLTTVMVGLVLFLLAPEPAPRRSGRRRPAHTGSRRPGHRAGGVDQPDDHRDGAVHLQAVGPAPPPRPDRHARDRAATTITTGRRPRRRDLATLTVPNMMWGIPRTSTTGTARS